VREPARKAARTRARSTVIDAYLAKVSDAQRGALEKLRKQILAIAPKAEECISYGLPAFRLDGKVVVGFGAGVRHCALYPWSGKITARFAAELEGYETSKGAIRFRPEKPLPATLLRRILKARVTDNAKG
jgi:uncharacterized protein YdhG (YjbR/CyaY superfamily)